MRVPNSEHQSLPWRITALVPDFRLEDVWEVPEIRGEAADFDRFVALATQGDPAHGENPVARVIWGVRDLLGRWFGLGEISSADAVQTPTLTGRLPADLVGTADDLEFAHLPFTPLYRTDDEFAAEIANATMHGVMHLGWRPDPAGGYRSQMAVYVRPNGTFGRAYMAFIKPFRYLVIYPALQRQLAATWQESRSARA